MKTTKRLFIALLAVSSLFFMGCHYFPDIDFPDFGDGGIVINATGNSSLSNVSIYGSKVPFGKGTAQTFLKVNGSNEVDEMGVALSESALNDLPHDVRAVLDLPQVIGPPTTHLKHVLLDFSQEGHEPVNIYTVPHFDVHFYNTSSADRETIVSNDSRFAVNPPDGYLPAVYVPAGPVPLMGMHWADPTSPEFNGQSFTSTFIYGSLDGKVTFYEPMITLDFLKNTTSQYFSIKQPTKFAKTGAYAQQYGLRHNNRERQYEVVLKDFKRRTGE
jgi:hypothetical protein